MKKRIFTLLCAAVMLFLLIPMPASAVVSELGRENGWVVGMDDRYPGEYIIIGYTGTSTTVTIPTKVKGWLIKGVHQFTFQDNTKIKTINVPDGVTVYSLGGCQVETVNFSKNAGVSSGAFKNCTKLQKVTLPETMDVLPAKIFENCGALKSVTIPEGIELIGEGAFSGCASLTELTLPDSVKEIRSRAFLNCTNLESINIPAAVTQIWGEEPFAGCRNLSEIKVNPENTVYYNDSEGNLLCNEHFNSRDHVVLVRSVAGNYGDSYTVPSHITCLDRACFSGVGGLKKLVIPATVAYVDGPIVENCPDLTEVWFEALPDRFIAYAFENAILDVYYPGDVGYWDNVIDDARGELTWIPYCTGVHKGEIGTVIEAATCTQTGLSENVCELCAETYIYTIPMTDHSYDDGVVTREAICMTSGELTYTCEVCGDFYTEIIYAPGHAYDYENMVTILEATCTEKGRWEAQCRDCDSRTQGEIAALGHEHSILTMVYDENGKNHGMKCVRCDDVTDLQSCTFDDGTVLTQATMDGHGLKKYTCTVCGGSYQQAYAYRLYGDNRCATAYAVADEMRAVLGGDKFNAILISCGDNFADALAGSFLAAKENSPILLYREKHIGDNAEYIRNNLKTGGKVYILGGTTAVSQKMEDAIEDFQVIRLSGATRFDTNLEILKEAGVTGGEILVATGWEFADSLSASAVGKPILLVNSIANTLTENQKEFLSTLEDARFTIIGGTAAVSEKLADELAVYGEVDRIHGTTREDTSVKVAEYYFENPDRIVVAYSRNFPDGLCGGPLAYALGVPLILTNAGQEGYAATYVEKHDIAKGAILGGEVAVSDATASRVFAYG